MKRSKRHPYIQTTLPFVSMFVLTYFSGCLSTDVPVQGISSSNLAVILQPSPTPNIDAYPQYVQYPPLIGTVSPQLLPIGRSSPVLVTGINFSQNPVIQFVASLPSGSPSPIFNTMNCMYPSPIPISSPLSQFLCQSPAFPNAGVFHVQVINSDGQSSLLPNAFVILAPPPTLSQPPINPSIATVVGNQVVTIYGNNFVAPNLVAQGTRPYVGGLLCTNAVVNAPSSIQCVVAPHAPGIVDVTVVNPDAQIATAAGSFLYSPVPLTNLTYSPNSFWLTIGSPMTNVTPKASGSPGPTFYSYTPTLPAGLTINSTTGVLSGTPSQEKPNTTYTVVASNSSSSTSTTLQIGILNFGTGKDGSVSYGSTDPQIINRYARITSPFTLDAASTTQFMVDDATGFQVGDQIMILQNHGVPGPLPSASTSPTVDPYNPYPLNWEIATINAVSGNTITLNGAVRKPYTGIITSPTPTNCQVNIFGKTGLCDCGTSVTFNTSSISCVPSPSPVVAPSPSPSITPCTVYAPYYQNQIVCDCATTVKVFGTTQTCAISPNQFTPLAPPSPVPLGVQIIRIPQYQNFTIGSGQVINAAPYNFITEKGGVIALLATGTVTINGTIDASGAGYPGGSSVWVSNATCPNYTAAAPGQSWPQNPYVKEFIASVTASPSPVPYTTSSSYPYFFPSPNPLMSMRTATNATGGGAGYFGASPCPYVTSSPSPSVWIGNGGGGSHATQGQTLAGSVVATTGLPGLIRGDADLTQILFGGGGGGSVVMSIPNCAPSPGGNGGGIIYIAAKVIQLGATGNILANGRTAPSTCSTEKPGGGAGGSIFLRGSQLYLGAYQVQALPGTGGGDGRIRIDYDPAQPFTGIVTPTPGASHTLGQ